jgi:hypothetical protein
MGIVLLSQIGKSWSLKDPLLPLLHLTALFLKPYHCPVTAELLAP